MKRLFGALLTPLLVVVLVSTGAVQQAEALSLGEVLLRNLRESGVINSSFIQQTQQTALRYSDVINSSANRDTVRTRQSSSRSPVLRRSSERQSSKSSAPALRLAATVSSAVSSANGNTLAAEVLRLVNEERAAKGLPAYKGNRILASSALDYAKHMKDTNCFSHTACGSSLKERMHDSGYYQPNGKSYSYGENIARGQKTAAQVMRDWMNSPSHRDAILSTKYLEIGIGLSGTYWVQHFGAIR